MADEKDKDLAKALQAAKSRPRNFAIIAKGPNVLKLIVDKRPIKEGLLRKIKQECHGNRIVRGVVCGGVGPELRFQVTEEPSLSDIKLRKFIMEEAQLPLKATFQLLEGLPGMDDEGPEAEEEDGGAQGATRVGPVRERSAPASGSDVAKFTARLKSLKPDLDKVLGARVSVSPQIKIQAQALAGLVKQKNFTAASQLLDQVRALVQRGLQELAAPSADARAQTAAFTARLKTLRPEIQNMIAAGGPLGQEVKLRTSEAGSYARQKHFEQANQVLGQVETLLQQSRAGTGAAAK